MTDASDSRDGPRADLLRKLAASAMGENPDRCRRLYQESLTISKAMNHREGQAEALFGLGEAARVSDRHRDALEYYSRGLEAYRTLGNLFEQGRCLRRIGDTHYQVANLDLSLRYYLRALRFFERGLETGRRDEALLQKGHLLSTIGNVLKDSGDLRGALDYYRRSHGVYGHAGYAEGISGVLYNMGTVLQEQGKAEEAAAIYLRVLEATRERGDRYLESLALNSLGSVYLEREDYPEAGKLFQQSMRISEQTGRNRGILSSLMKLMELKRLSGDDRAALEISDRAEQLSIRLSDRSARCRVLRERAHILQNTGEHRQAFTTLSLFQKLQEEILSGKRVRQIDILRLRYETEAKELEIERLRREKSVQKTLITGAALGLLLAGITISSVYRGIRLRTRVNRELASAYSKVEELSRTDDLTGLANRRAMIERLGHEEARYRRSGRKFGLILGDIDGFKSWNDRCGHECGDGILVELASRLRREMREQDLLSRWGGEEFLALLPDTDLAGTAGAAEKLRQALEARPFLWKGWKIPLTMTFGVCEGGGLPVDEALRMADSALYRGKKSGKNKVVSSTAD